MPGNDPIFPIGVRCIEQALQRAGHSVRLVDFVEAPDAARNLDWAGGDWDVVGFAVRNIDPIDLACDGHVDAYGEFVGKVRRIARPSAVFVGGGPGYSLFADSLTRKLGFNVGVRGPGEEVMREVAADPRRFASGQTVVDGRRYDGFVSEVLEHPSRLMGAYAVERGAMIGVETRRKTCFQRCIYCPYAYITGNNFGDAKPIEVLRAEIAEIYNAGFRRIFFTDSIFNSGITYAKEVMRMLAGQQWTGLSWSAYFAALPFDDVFAGLLKESGVETVVVSPDSLDNDLMKRLGKNFDLPAMDRFMATSRRHGLRPMVNVVFGGPGETRQTAGNTARYINASLDTDELSMHVGYRILPHTSLAAETGLGEEALLYPTFYPFDPALFQWIMHDLESRFLTAPRLMNLLAGRASMKRMAKVFDAGDRVTPHAGGAVALSRIRVLDVSNSS